MMEWAIILAALQTGAPGTTCPLGGVPPVDRQTNEVALQGNAFLEAHCPQWSLMHSWPREFRARNLHFSHSIKWGDIVRTDIGYPKKSTRIVCYKQADVQKVQIIIYNLDTNTCIVSEENTRFTIYPPLSNQN